MTGTYSQAGSSALRTSVIYGGAPVKGRIRSPVSAIAVNPSLALSNVKQLLEEKSLKIHEKHKLPLKQVLFMCVHHKQYRELVREASAGR